MRDALRVLAAPRLGETSGGIGQVSAMLWDVMRETWPDRSRALELMPGDTRLGWSGKTAFGMRLGGLQVSGRVAWILFTHIGLLRALRFVPRSMRAPYGVFLHGIESWTPLAPWEIDLLRGAEMRLTNSQFTADRASAANRGIGDVIVCPLALPGIVPPVQSSRPGRPIALIVGRLDAGERYKGHTQLIEAWPVVLARVPDAELIIAGDGDDRLRLERLVRESGAGRSIRFTGFVSRTDLERLYGEAAVFVLPSRGEGFGLVYLEAMAHRLPCIGSVHDAAREIVVDGQTGLLVDPDDPAALSAALVRVLTDESFRRAAGDAGRERLLTQFSRERFNRQVRAELERYVESPALRRRTREAVT